MFNSQTWNGVVCTCGQPQRTTVPIPCPLHLTRGAVVSRKVATYANSSDHDAAGAVLKVRAS